MNREKMTEMSVVDEYRGHLHAKLEEAKAAIDYYSASKSGEWSHRTLAKQWEKKKAEIQAKLHKEQIAPEEFEWDSILWKKRNAFPLH